MDLLVFFLGGFVFFVALLKRELLVEDGSFKVIRGVSVALFLAGVILHFLTIGRETPSGALLASLISLYFFRIARILFVKRFHREPIDTFLIWSKGLAPDRLFNITFFILVAFIWMSSAILTNELTKVGF